MQFERKDPWLSLCGLNCGLCPMRLGNHCGGCGRGSSACRIARCSLAHGGVAYCFQCSEYPCSTYAQIDAFDSFISHRNQKSDLARAARLGADAYGAEQREKRRILDRLLADYNDGRRKTFYCVAVNLLELQTLREILQEIAERPEIDRLPPKERSACVAGLFQRAAEARGLELKLRRKK